MAFALVFRPMTLNLINLIDLPIPAALLAALLASGAACGGGSPTEPTDSGSSRQFVEGRTISAVDSAGLPGVSLRLGNRPAIVSDSTGYFRLEQPDQGRYASVLSASSIVERRTDVTMPPAGELKLSLIPTSFDLTAFDQMFRASNERLQRWTSAPPLVVITSVMNFTSTFQTEFTATDERLTEDEVNAMIGDLTSGLGQLTGNIFRAFSSIDRENAAAGKKVDVNREGFIVVGRYRGIQGFLKTVGYGRWLERGDGTVIGGAVFLDRDFDKQNDQRVQLRIHELGHALGYSHVTARESVMNPTVGPLPTEFDRQAASIAFQRPPGNRAPDTDPTTGGLSSMTTGYTLRWSPPIP